LFFPNTFGIVLFSLFILLMSRYIKKGDLVNFVLLSIVFSGLVLTHFVSSLAALSILIVYFLLGKKLGLPRKTLHILPFLGIFIMYQIWYDPGGVLQQFVLSGKTLLSDLGNGGIFAYVSSVANANFNLVPWWINDVRLFWTFFIFIFGAICITGTFKVRTWHLQRRFAFIGLLGLATLAIIMTVISESSYYIIFFLYAAFFTVPAIITLFHRKKLLIPIMIMFIILSYPSFAAINIGLGNIAVYPSDISEGVFLRSYVPTHSAIISDGTTMWVIDLPNIQYQNPPGMTNQPTQAIAQENMANLINNFHSGNSLFILNDRILIPYYQFFGQDFESKIQYNLTKTLLENDLVFSNGNSSFFVDQR